MRREHPQNNKTDGASPCDPKTKPIRDPNTCVFALFFLNSRRSRKKSGKPWTLFRSPEKRDQLLEEFNRSTLDDVGPLEHGQEMKVLQEMNELGKEQEKIIRDGVPKVNVLQDPRRFMVIPAVDLDECRLISS